MTAPNNLNYLGQAFEQLRVGLYPTGAADRSSHWPTRNM